MAIRNGYLDATMLTRLPWSPQYQLRPGAAASLADLSARHRARFGVPLPIVYAYRDYAAQVAFWNSYRNGTGNLAAVPGTSNHGLGIAVDVGAPDGSWGTTQQAWLRANVGTAWVFEVPTEPWHIRFTGNPNVPIPPVPPVPPNPPIPPVPPQEDIVASLADLEAVVAPVSAQVAQVEVSVLEISHRVDADRKIGAAYRLDGGQAVWQVHPGVGREHLTADAYGAMGAPRILPVSPTNGLWSMEILGDVGELFRKVGDTTGAAFLLAAGGIRHVTAEEDAAMTPPPVFTDLPDTHPLWVLPVLP